MAVTSNKYIIQFQSTLPVWGATAVLASFSSCLKFQSTLPVWGATSSRMQAIGYDLISIHAPRVGSDSGNSQ